MSDLVLPEDRGPVRHLVLNRPEKRNAFNLEVVQALDARLREAAADADVQCVVLRGAGPVFSAGIDLQALAELAPQPGTLRPFRAAWVAACAAAESMPKPVICQIHGACLGGALETALACDLRVAAADARLGLPETRMGLIPDVGGSSRLPAVVGLGRAKELIMTARLIDGAEAERIGLVNRAVPADELDAATEALIQEILEGSPAAAGRAKLVMDASARPALAATLELEVALQELCAGELRARAGAS